MVRIREYVPAGSKTVALVGVGGFAGANLRYAVGGAIPGSGGTVVANTVGSFLLGALLYSVIYTGALSTESRTLLSTGLLSSFTTYSTFALETARSPTATLLLANVVVTYALGFAGVLVGRTLARRIDGGGLPW